MDRDTHVVWLAMTPLFVGVINCANLLMQNAHSKNKNLLAIIWTEIGSVTRC